MIYIDPPFYSKADYKAKINTTHPLLKDIALIEQKAYKDTWENGIEEYLQALSDRIIVMKELLKDSGSIFLHLDWHIVHYVKIIMDEIFGAEQFVNEIIWTYKSGGVSKRYFARKHDTILMYGKTKDYKYNPQKEKSYNRGFKPYKFKNVEEFQDDIGWHTMVNMKDVWQIDMVGRTSGERVSYATQKPEKLLERVIKSTTDEGDLCIDFYGGSGTLGAVADKLNRRWMMCDQGDLSILTQLKRMTKIEADFSYEKTINETPKTDVTLSIDRVKDDITDLYHINIKSYGYKAIDVLPIHKKYGQNIKSIANEDCHALLDFVIIYEIDSEDNRSIVFQGKEPNQIENAIEIVLNESKKYEMIIFDIFGIETIKEIYK